MREERAEAERDREAIEAAQGRRGRSAPPAAARPPRRRRTSSGRPKKIEAEIEAAEAALRRLEEELADPAAWNDPRTAAKSTRRHERAKRALQTLYAEWEAVAG